MYSPLSGALGIGGIGTNFNVSNVLMLYLKKRFPHIKFVFAPAYNFHGFEAGLFCSKCNEKEDFSIEDLEKVIEQEKVLKHAHDGKQLSLQYEDSKRI